MSWWRVAPKPRNMLADDMVDRIVIFQGPGRLGADGIAAPVDRDHIPAGFRLVREARFGDDVYAEWTRGF